jgi:N-methylhydantoinase A
MRTPPARASRLLLDPAGGGRIPAALHARERMQPGMRIAGPALIVEDDTTTVVPPSFVASVNALGYLVLDRARVDGKRRKA